MNWVTEIHCSNDYYDLCRYVSKLSRSTRVFRLHNVLDATKTVSMNFENMKIASFASRIKGVMCISSTHFAQ